MTNNQTRKGPRRYRFGVATLNILLAILIYWLLGFALKDLASYAVPSLEKVQQESQNTPIAKQHDDLVREKNTLLQALGALERKQSILQTSTQNYKDTMNQLLDLQKTGKLSNDMQKNLAHAMQLYFENQQQFQGLMNNIADLNNQIQLIDKKNNIIAPLFNAALKQAYDRYQSELREYRFKTAVMQSCVLLPLFFIAIVLFLKFRHSIYRSILIALNIALIAKIVVIMHEYFPAWFFKYIFILILIALVMRALIKLLRTIAAPKPDWLLSRYKEAYQKKVCPDCDYAISFDKKDETYSCPSCGKKLFEKCNACGHSKHALLSFCEKCGSSQKGI